MQPTTLSFEDRLTMDQIIPDLLDQAKAAYIKSPANRNADIPSFVV